MRNKNDPKNDPSRLAIAVFIVATTLTILTSNYSVPSIILIPLGMFLWGLIVSAVLAFLFILTKGYELRYGKNKNNLIDKYNYILYNLAVTAYVIVMIVILFGLIYKNLDEASKGGNVWASVGVGVLFIGLVGIINGRDVKELSITVWNAFKDRLHKNK